MPVAHQHLNVDQGEDKDKENEEDSDKDIGGELTDSSTSLPVSFKKKSSGNFESTEQVIIVDLNEDLS